MKYLLSFLIILLVSFSLVPSISTVGEVSAGWIIFSNKNSEIPYCNGGQDCGLGEGLEDIKDIDTIETNMSASQFIQKIIVYILGFLQLLAVGIIIYSGAVLLTGVGDEEKAKKTKNIILYAVLGLIIIWLAYPLTIFIFTALNGG